MNINSILAPERVVTQLSASSKKRAIELAARHLAGTLPQLDSTEVYRALIERERLGTTALGEGVALPHCRLPGCQSIVGGLFVCEQGLDFSALDDIPVRIMFVLLVPETEDRDHVKTLAMLASHLQSPDYRQGLLDAKDRQSLFAAATLPVAAATDVKQANSSPVDASSAPNQDDRSAR